MTKMTHTPGPWRAWKEGSSDDGGPWQVELSDGGDIWIGTNKEDEFNAHLIAAAPDMLAALKEAAGFCESSLSCDGTYDPAEETLKEIRAAIAKATGEK